MTSFFSGFVIFSVLGYMSQSTGKPIDKVATEGPKIIFFLFEFKGCLLISKNNKISLKFLSDNIKKKRKKKQLFIEKCKKNNVSLI